MKVAQKNQKVVMPIQLNPCVKCFNSCEGVLVNMLVTGPEFCDEDQEQKWLCCPTCGYRERLDD